MVTGPLLSVEAGRCQLPTVLLGQIRNTQGTAHPPPSPVVLSEAAQDPLLYQGEPGCLQPIVLTMSSLAPLKFSATPGFYDTAWVTPAIIYV